MWVDMPVPARDRSALRAHFRRQQLGLLVDGMRVQFRLTGELTSPATAPPLTPRQNGHGFMFTQGRVTEVSPGALYAVIAILILSLLLLGAGAVVALLLSRGKRKTEPTDAAAAGDGHVY